MNKRPAQIVAMLALTIAAACSTATAHDSWLIADRHLVNDGDAVWCSFVTGEVFPFGEAATKPARVHAYADYHGGVVRQITDYGPEDKGLSAKGPMSGTGFHIIGCVLKPRLIDLKPEVFKKYLTGERADKALADYKLNPGIGSVVTERYTKLGKTVIEVQPTDEADRGYAVPIGHPLEIIPLTNPCRWSPGESVRVQVLLDGHPWPDVPVSAGHEGLGEHEYAEHARTDLSGIATIPLKRTGHWFIKAHFIRRTEGLGKHQWESYWASLTFKVGGAVNTTAAIQAIKAVHGELNPWAVAGYRMGAHAMASLSLERGTGRLIVMHQTPLELPYIAVADGIQAATGATTGKMTLRLKAGTPETMSSTFSDRVTQQSMHLRITQALKKEMQETAPKDLGALALRVLTMKAEAVFETVADNKPSEDEPTMAKPTPVEQAPLKSPESATTAAPAPPPTREPATVRVPVPAGLAESLTRAIEEEKKKERKNTKGQP